MKNCTRSIVIAVLLIAQVPLFGQTKIWFDSHWKKTKEKNAKFYRIITPESDGFLVQDYYKSNDQMQMEGHYKTKKLNAVDRYGKFTYYYENGTVSNEGEYNKGKSDGDWNSFYKDGEKKVIRHYDDGDRTGNWEFYWKNGKLKGKGAYEKDDKQGVWIWFYETGDTEEIYSYLKGKKHGEFIEFFKGHKINEKGSYVKDSLEGNFVHYWENGNLSQKGLFKNNKRDGAWEWYHSNGKISCNVDYKNDKFIRGTYYDEEGEKQTKKVTDKNLYKGAEFPGGTEKLYAEINERLGKHIDIPGAKKAKYKFYGIIRLHLDEEGEIIRTEWVSPDLEDDEWEDEWEMVENINTAIEGFPRFEPCKAYNRNTPSTFVFYYTIDFSKL